MNFSISYEWSFVRLASVITQPFALRYVFSSSPLLFSHLSSSLLAHLSLFSGLSLSLLLTLVWLASWLAGRDSIHLTRIPSCLAGA